MKLNSDDLAENNEVLNPANDCRKRKNSDENAIVHDLSIKKNVLGAFPQDPKFSKASTTDQERNGHRFRKAFSDAVERRGTTKQMFFPIYQNKQIPPHGFNDSKNLIGATQNTVTRPLPLAGVSAANALISTVQQQRLVQGNPNAQYFFQSLRNSYERYAAINWLKQLAQSNLNNGMNFPENMMELKLVFLLCSTLFLLVVYFYSPVREKSLHSWVEHLVFKTAYAAGTMNFCHQHYDQE